MNVSLISTTTLLFCAGLAVSAPAFAQSTCPESAVGCDIQSADWSHRDALFDTIDYDTGWLPGGSPLQLRATLHIAGETQVDVGAEPTTHWPPPLSVAVPGRAESGRLAMDYGLELRVYFRFDVRVLGIRYRAEREIDIPSVPMDLLLAAEGQFDPFLFPPAEPFSVRDTTESVPFLGVDLDDVIDLPSGVDGGISLAFTAALETRYHTTSVHVDDLPAITEIGQRVVQPPMSVEGYGPARDMVIHPEGVLDYDGMVILTPSIYIEIAGRRFDLLMLDLPISLVNTDTNVVFDEVDIHVPLPDVSWTPESFDFGTLRAGQNETRVMRIENIGEATLEVMLVPPDHITLSQAEHTLAPGSAVAVEVSYSPRMAGPAGDLRAPLVMNTNDPDKARVRIPMEGRAMPGMDAGTDAGFDAGVESADAGTDAAPDAADFSGVAGGACGCHLAGSEGTNRGLAGTLWVVGLLWVRRRRSRK